LILDLRDYEPDTRVTLVAAASITGTFGSVEILTRAGGRRLLAEDGEVKYTDSEVVYEPKQAGAPAASNTDSTATGSSATTEASTTTGSPAPSDTSPSAGSPAPSDASPVAGTSATSDASPAAGTSATSDASRPAGSSAALLLFFGICAFKMV
jgi:hypothetical protein